MLHHWAQLAVLGFIACMALVWVQHACTITKGPNGRVIMSPDLSSAVGPVAQTSLHFETRRFQDISGSGFRIYRPALQGIECNTKSANQQIFGHPEAWKLMLVNRLEILDTITITVGDHQESVITRASIAYAEMLKGFCSGAGFGKAEKTVIPGSPPYNLHPFSAEARKGGTKQIPPC